MNKKRLIVWLLISLSTLIQASMPIGVMPVKGDPEPSSTFSARAVSAPQSSQQRINTTRLKGRSLSIGITRELSRSAISEVDVQASIKSSVTGKLLNYPNPCRFNTEGTTIGYYLSKDMDITLDIFDAVGNKLLSKTYDATENGGSGSQYNEIVLSTSDFNGASLSAGIYFYYLLNEGDILAKSKLAVIP
ncbi:hypothetical protein DID80_08385 [Candidatus Marinamargulisbacteria bacterium SCGC AAA071-K20]|nr:hypothetical protein DID80_08385 [Candidatus Marinamargulisbacteria bacterium SCGC AAA071-K20]